MKRLILGGVLIILGAIVPVISLVKSVKFDQQCGGYLKQAADANTVELALDRVNIALNYIEANKLTDGYTSVLWKTEDDNVGYWYANIKACQAELTDAIDAESQLEKSNVLMKVRESLTDNGEKGTKLTFPDGISRYPNNLLFGILNWLSVVLLVIGLSIVFIELDILI